MIRVVVSSVLAAVFASAVAGAQTVPCSQPSACADLKVDPNTMTKSWRVATSTFSATNCAVVEGEVVAGTRKLLRFTTTYPNIGTAALVVGAPSVHPEWFEYSPCHKHYHFKDYTDYRLWTAQGYSQWVALRAANPSTVLSRDLLLQNPSIAAQMLHGDKRGFCVIDVKYYGPKVTGKPPTPVYADCLNNQGISVNWADEYNYTLSGQWIDITGAPSGTYTLEVEVNAEHLFTELDYSNNSAAIQVQF